MLFNAKFLLEWYTVPLHDEKLPYFGNLELPCLSSSSIRAKFGMQE